MAAAAVIQTMKKHRIFPSNPLHRPRSSTKSQVTYSEAECTREREFVAAYKDNDTVLSPPQICEDPRTRGLGVSSPALKVGDFDLLRTLGTGTFARVWLAKLAKPTPSNQNADRVYALKILRKVDIIRLKQVEHVQNERTSLCAVAGHPFITTLITTFSDQECLYMLLDYCPGGEVFTYLRRQQKFSKEVATFYAAEIVLVLEYLHEYAGIAYRDLKPENILIDAEGHLKLVDFGFAKKLGKTLTYTLCGTPEYLAPEVIRNTGHGCAVDWWALGILIYEFLVGQPPFWDSNPMKIYSKIVDGKMHFPNSMDADAKDLIKQLCTVNPAERLGHVAGGAAKVKEHAFFKGTDWDSLYYRKVKGPIIPRVRHAADASNYDDYDYDHDPKKSTGSGSVYTKEMQHSYENSFKDF